MRVNYFPSLLAVAAALLSAPLHAQETESPIDTGPDPVAGDEALNQILVYGARLVGQIDAPQPPILELDSEDIAAYGAGSIAELIQALGPQVSSGRGRGGGGRPVILVNGVRISSFRELRSYPPEAIARTEVFSEEVAQRYGYSADQRVVNIILKPDFSSRELELEYGQPWDGGYSTQEVEGTYLQVDGPRRLNLNLEWNTSSLLTEAERGVVQPDGSIPTFASDPDPAAFRSLVGESSSVEATANWTAQLGESGNSLSVNATYERDNSLRLQGIDTVLLADPGGSTALRSFNSLDPLAVDRRGQDYSAGGTLNLGLGDWQVTGTVDATVSHSRSRTEARIDSSQLVAAAAAGMLALDGDLGSFPDAGFTEAVSDTYTINALVTARGTPIVLPAGDLAVTFTGGFRSNGIESTDTRNPDLLTDLDRTRWQSGVNLGIPLTSRDEDFAGALGDLSLNLNAAIYEQSDFGALYDWSAGLIWGVFEKLTLSATYLARDSSPSLSQLGNPQIVTPNVPVFDIANNETVLVSVITGGNPLLPAQVERDWKFGLNWDLPFLDNARLQVEYFDNHSKNVTDSFPVLTPEIESAFADRVTRDAGGRLVQLDERFVTYAEQDVERVQVGLNLSGRLGSGGSERGGDQAGQRGRPRAGPVGGPVNEPAEARGPRNPEQFARMRAQFCGSEPEIMLAQLNAAARAQANGEPAPIDESGEPINIPPRMLARLAGDDGQVDPERFASVRERICSGDALARGRPEAPPAAATGAQRGAGASGFGRFGGGPPRGRWFANLQYSHEFENSVLIAPGLARLDLLGGDALAGGGIPRDSVSLRGGLFYNGYGLRTDASYTGASTIAGSGLPGSTDLVFGDIFKLDLRVFIDLGQRKTLVEAAPFLEGTRLSFRVDNVFDARQRVVDSMGDTPLRYQPFLIDPVGQFVRLELRKLF